MLPKLRALAYNGVSGLTLKVMHCVLYKYKMMYLNY